MDYRILGFVMGFALSEIAPAPAQQSGTISGTVVDESSRPIPGAVVRYNNVRKFDRDAAGRLIPAGPVVSSGTRSAADGTFGATGLPAGSYYLCASGIRPNHLRSCEWGQPSLALQLAAGQTLSGVTLRIVEGTLLIFRVRDVRAVIQDTAAGPPVNGRLPLFGGNFRIGITAGTRYAQGNFVSQIGAVRSYTVAVPKFATVRLFLDTPLTVLGPLGQVLEARAPSLPITTTGQAELAIDLEVP